VHQSGYTIYSTKEGTCVLHGRYGGCLRIGGEYACFPAFEEAKNLIKYFRAQGIASWEYMERDVPEEAYVCLNRDRQWDANRTSYSLAAVKGDERDERGRQPHLSLSHRMRV
jgi:hypothetical protein